ncbi:MAG TPA: glycosyltransferase, partial [Treponemataceae bacterium]|nr:glycosyltransferase [Treponemataceae bacterium]
YSLEGITAFSTAPLIFASVMGMLFCLIAFITICVVVVKTLLWGDPVAGYPSLLSIILFIGGVQLFAVGILGQYLAKTYLETKKRPVYIIKEQSK